MFDVIDLPPSSFLLTDLLPFCFIAQLVAAIVRRRSASPPPAGQWVAIATGLLAPCVLMLTAMSLTYRYRMEFYPEIDFLAFLGFYLTLTDDATMAAFARVRKWMAVALAVSILASVAALTLFDNSDMGPSEEYLRNGIVRYYSQAATQDYQRAARYFATH